MDWFPLLTWMVFPAASLLGDRRYAGDEGRRRVLELDAFEGQALRRSYLAAWPRWALVAAAALYGVNVVGAVVLREWLVAGLAAVGAALSVAALRTRARVAPQVLAARPEQELPVARRELSRRRTRRVRQFGVTAAVAYVAGSTLLTGRALLDTSPAAVATVLGLTLLVVGTLALCGLAWAAAWRYGDERPAPES